MEEIKENIKSISLALMKLKDLETDPTKKQLLNNSIELSMITYKLLDDETTKKTI